VYIIMYDCVTYIHVSCITERPQYFSFQLERASEAREIKELLDSDDYSFRFDVGCSFPTSNIGLINCDQIVSSLASYYTVVRVKAQIDQMVEGLGVLGVLDLLRSNPQSAKQLFIHSKPLSMTADLMLMMFTPRLSPEGSNRREDEEQVIMLWANFLQMIEGKSIL